MQNGLYKKLDKDEQKIEDFRQRYERVAADHRLIVGFAVTFYFIGSILFLGFKDKIETIGIICLGFSVLLFLFSFYTGNKKAVLDFEGQMLFNKYTRKQALPFYRRLLEKFADEPDIKVDLTEEGLITLSERKDDAKK